MTEYQTFVAAVSQIPGARWWLEELLVRGTKDGTIAGAHVIIGAELTDPLGGKTLATKGPYPLDALNVLSGQPATDWTAVLGGTLSAQQATIDARDTTIMTLTAERDAAVTLAAERASMIATLEAAAVEAAQEIATLTARVAELEAAAEAAATSNPETEA